MITDLAIYQKTYDLYLYTHKFILKMPKAERFLISRTLQEALLAVIKLMTIANQQRDKVVRLGLMDDIEGQLLIYLTTLRLAADLKMLSRNKYGYAAKLTAELLRILAGWKKC